MKIFKKITILSILIIIMLTYMQTLVFAAESELTLTPKPETNNIHLKWTGPINSSYKVFQKKPGATQFLLKVWMEGRNSKRRRKCN